MSVGYDHLSMDEIKKRNIKVRSTTNWQLQKGMHLSAKILKLDRNELLVV